jgi:L-threonylcarbamoyladenylate synthase
MAYLVDRIAALDILRGNGVVAFPTETVFGLGGRVGSEQAIKKIFELKGRPATNPLIVHCSDVDQLQAYVRFTTKMQSTWAAVLAQHCWPGPLTLVLPKTDLVSDAVSAGLDSVAIRLPAHPVALDLIRSVGDALAAPSANTSNYLSPTSASHVLEDFEGADLGVIEAGNSEIGLESTVLSLLGDVPIILRSGAVTAEMLTELLGVTPQRSKGDLHNGRSPGMMHKHYSPVTPFFIIRTREEIFKQRSGRHCLVSCLSSDLEGSLPTGLEHCILSPTNKLEEAASRFFGCLHELDKKNFDSILFLACDEKGIGAAIMERVEKAAA